MPFDEGLRQNFPLDKIGPRKVFPLPVRSPTTSKSNPGDVAFHFAPRKNVGIQPFGQHFVNTNAHRQFRLWSENIGTDAYLNGDEEHTGRNTFSLVVKKFCPSGVFV